MHGKGDRTRTASEDSAGKQAPGHTGHQTFSRGSLLAEGGKQHMSPKQAAQPAKAGQTGKPVSDSKQASGGLSATGAAGAVRDLKERKMLTRQDLDNFGPELLDVATRAARHALAPELQQLHEENQQLRNEVGRAAKMSIDQYLDREVPNWRQINADERFHSWLLMPDTYSGVIRDRLLKDAAHAANAQRVASFFKGFLQEQGAGVQAPASPAPQRARRAPSGRPIYTRGQISEMWARRRKGEISDEQWARWEYELCLASKEGRVVGALSLEDGIPVTR
jgi:hypothetical protein